MQLLKRAIACLGTVAVSAVQAQNYIEEVRVVGVNDDGVIEWYSQTLGDFCVANPNHDVCVALNESGSLGPGMPAYSTSAPPCSQDPTNPMCTCYGQKQKVFNEDTGVFQCLRPPLHCTDGRVNIGGVCQCPAGTYWHWTAPGGAQCVALPSAPSCACGSPVALEEAWDNSPWMCKPEVWCHFQNGVNFVAPAACQATLAGMAGVICAAGAAGGAATAIPSGGTSVLVTGAVCSATFAAFVELSGVCDGIQVFE